MKGPTMTKNQEALKFMEDYLALERRIKILELELRQVNEITTEAFEDKCHRSTMDCLEDIYNKTERYLQ